MVTDTRGAAVTRCYEIRQPVTPWLPDNSYPVVVSPAFYDSILSLSGFCRRGGSGGVRCLYSFERDLLRFDAAAFFGVNR